MSSSSSDSPSSSYSDSADDDEDSSDENSDFEPELKSLASQSDSACEPAPSESDAVYESCSPDSDSEDKTESLFGCAARATCASCDDREGNSDLIAIAGVDDRESEDGVSISAGTPR